MGSQDARTWHVDRTNDCPLRVRAIALLSNAIRSIDVPLLRVFGACDLIARRAFAEFLALDRLPVRTQDSQEAP